MDIITPLVDDPATFGRIAVTNALSDVYAMGGRPLTAMNLVFFPACSLPGEILADILAGGREVLRDAGVCLVGGHTVEDAELKYGVSVTGVVDPAGIIRNSTAQPDDLLILTKPLGTGIISTGIKGEMASEEAVSGATRWMTTLNRDAAALMVDCRATAATDVTGFGLIGHAAEMARGAGVTIRLEIDRIPLMAGVPGLVNDGMIPAGCYRNRDYCLPLTLVSGQAPDDLLPLFDPQTSGGLLISLPPERAAGYLASARQLGIFACIIGSVIRRGSHVIEII